MLVFSKMDIRNVSLAAIISAGLYWLFGLLVVNFLKLEFFDAFIISISGISIVFVQKDGPLIYTLSRLFVGSLIFGFFINLWVFFQYWSLNSHMLGEALTFLFQSTIWYASISFFIGLITILIKGSVSLCRQKFKKQ